MWEYNCLGIDDAIMTHNRALEINLQDVYTS